MDNRHEADGHRGNHNGFPTQAQRANGLRVPTVHEALTFTPFSSIVPFNPGKLASSSLALGSISNDLTLGPNRHRSAASRTTSSRTICLC